MLDIPSEVFHDILSRLPADTLLRFRCVAKAWRDTIDDSIFVRSHLRRQIHGSSAGQLILRGDLCTWLYSLSINSLNCEIIKAMPMNHNPCLRGSRSPVGSCNGVLLISDLKGYHFLWNPNTREVHRLPPPPKVMSKKCTGLYLSKCGLGFDCAADDYKVVKIAQVFDPRNRILNSETFLYSLNLDSWRRIKDFPYRISRLSGGAVFFSSVLHWISSTTPLKCMDDLIIGLHLGTEDYHKIPMPSQLSGETKHSGKILGVLGECMILSCYYQIECLDVWLMKDYGVHSSWIKLFSIGAVDCIGAVETLRPLVYSKCRRQVLLQHDKKEFFWFNLETKMVKKMRIHRGPNIFSSQFCLASLVRLNGKNAKRPSRGKSTLASLYAFTD